MSSTETAKVLGRRYAASGTEMLYPPPPTGRSRSRLTGALACATPGCVEPLRLLSSVVLPPAILLLLVGRCPLIRYPPLSS